MGTYFKKEKKKGRAEQSTRTVIPLWPKKIKNRRRDKHCKQVVREFWQAQKPFSRTKYDCLISKTTSGPTNTATSQCTNVIRIRRYFQNKKKTKKKKKKKTKKKKKKKTKKWLGVLRPVNHCGYIRAKRRRRRKKDHVTTVKRRVS